RAGARGEGGAVELALEGAARLSRGKAEAGAGATGNRRGRRRQSRIGRRRIDRPAEGRRSRVGIPRRVDGPDLERMRAGGERGVVLRAGACGEGGAVELALEGAARLSRGKAEAGAGGVGQ